MSSPIIKARQRLIFYRKPHLHSARVRSSSILSFYRSFLICRPYFNARQLSDANNAANFTNDMPPAWAMIVAAQERSIYVDELFAKASITNGGLLAIAFFSAIFIYFDLENFTSLPGN